jgi:hypothetical protein
MILTTITTITVKMPINIFTCLAIGIVVIYFFTRIGSKEASYHLTLIVIVLATIVFCMGLDPRILHFLATLKH